MVDTENNVAERAPTAEPSLGQLVAGIADDAQQLIRQQYQMLRAEIREDIRRTKTVVKYMAVGGFASMVGLLFLIVAAPLFINWMFGLPTFAGFAIIGGTFLVVGLVALFIGKRLTDKYNPLPDKTLNALEENLSWISNPRK